MDNEVWILFQMKCCLWTRTTWNADNRIHNTYFYNDRKLWYSSHAGNVGIDFIPKSLHANVTS